MRDFEKRIQQHLGGDWGIVAVKLHFSPYPTNPEHSFRLIETTSEERTVTLEEISTVVAGLATMWSREIQFKPYWFARRKTPEGYVLGGPQQAPSIEQFALAFVEALLAEPVTS
jgi:hypothetical protein